MTVLDTTSPAISTFREMSLKVPVCCWTKLTIPTSRTIEEEASEDGRRWRSASTHVNPKKAPGFTDQFFGRVIESPETVWYITAWDCHEALQDYQKSENCRLQNEDLATFSSTLLETHECDVDSNCGYHVTRNTSFIDAYFPINISDEGEQIVDRTPGLRYRMGPEYEAYIHRCARGWLHSTRNYGGEDALVVRFWNFWRSRESEKRFRGGIPDPKQDYYLGIHEQFMEHLEKAGVLGITEFHCSLERILNYWRPREAYPESDEEHPSDEDPADENEEDENI